MSEKTYTWDDIEWERAQCDRKIAEVRRLVYQANSPRDREHMAMAEAGRREHERRAGRDATLAHFKDHVWNAWVNYRDEPEQLPADWEYAIVRQLDSGLTMADLTEAVQSTMTKTYVRTDHFRYFMGVCKTMLAERMDRARAIIAEEDES